MSPDAARKVLVGTAIPDYAFGVRAHCKPGAANSNKVIWNIEGGPNIDINSPRFGEVSVIMKLRATLTAADGGTQVAVDIQPPDGGSLAAVEKENPAIIKLFRSLAVEQVDAKLTHREFDVAGLAQQITAAMLTQVPQFVQGMTNASANSRR